MGWKWLKEMFGRTPYPNQPELRWADPTENEWGVPVLDVRPVTHNVVSLSRNKEHAANSVSFTREDGRCFIACDPEIRRTITSDLTYLTAGKLYDGILYVPEVMEQKWALFFHGDRILCVRTWTRTVGAVAKVVQRQGQLTVVQIDGVISSPNEDSAYTCKLLDYLIRSHVLGEVYPLPLQFTSDRGTREIANWCFGVFGCNALLASTEEIRREIPSSPLRTNSLLHIAVAMGALDKVQAHLDDGMPIDLRDSDGAAPLHCAIFQADVRVLEFLLDKGATVDLPSDVGETPLMYAVNMGEMEYVSLLINRGAGVNAMDINGGTALHRAAELGHVGIVRELLRCGAERNLTALGHTPESVAAMKGHDEVVQVLQDCKNDG